MEKYISLAVTICALFGFIWGINRFIRQNGPLYARMIIFGVGCAMLGRLFETLLFYTTGELQSGLSVLSM